jgi:HSP20 family protein
VKTVISQTSLLALALAAVAGTVHAADCPDRAAAVTEGQTQSMSTPAREQAVSANPWAELVRMQAVLEHPFDVMSGLPVMFVSLPTFTMPVPVSALQRTQDGYRLEIPLPGFKPEDIHVRLDGQLLSITAETTSTTKVGDQDMQNRSSRSFAETVTLPGSVKASEMKQSFDNGVLILTLPGKEGKA